MRPRDGHMLRYEDGEELYWDHLHREVRFSVPGQPRVLLCRIEARALEREGANAGEPASYLATARRCYGHITHRISEKLALGLTEPDGSVLVRERDW